MGGTTRLEGKLVEKMRAAGFPLARRFPLSARPLGKIFYPESELIFNRALDGKSSSFCVIGTREEDRSVTLHYYDPDPQGTFLPASEFLRKTNLPENASDEALSSAVRGVSEASSRKKANEYHFSPHNHFGSISRPLKLSSGDIVKPGMVEYDDGVSFLTDNLRKALFYHTDYYALSCHNSFSKNTFDIMSWAGHYLGLVPVPSIELTLALKEPNGPHVLVWMKNSAVGEKVRRSILDHREPLDMPSFFNGMEMGEMLDILFSFQQQDDLALGIAHPVNFNSPKLPIPLVGLYSAVDTGAITLDTAHFYAQHFDSIAMWNSTTYQKAAEPRLENPGLRSYLRHLNRKHVGNRRLWANQSNYSLAQELSQSFGTYTHFETDEHKALPFVRDDKGYVLGGDSAAAGTTVIEVPGADRRPGSTELIGLIRKRAVSMYGRLFAVMRKDAVTVHRERSLVPEKLRKLSRKADHALMMRYAGMVARDFLDFLLSGEFQNIEHFAGN